MLSILLPQTLNMHGERMLSSSISLDIPRAGGMETVTDP